MRNREEVADTLEGVERFIDRKLAESRNRFNRYARKVAESGGVLDLNGHGAVEADRLEYIRETIRNARERLK